MPQLARNASAQFTWDHYQQWPDDERWELIGGTAFAMAPAPSTRHQTVAGRLHSRLEQRLSGKPCQPFMAPTDVKLSEFDVVQPDILVICNPDKVMPNHIEGAPDVVIEVLSPRTATRDLRDKKALYERFGVKEYIIIDPLENYAIRFLRGDDGLFNKGNIFGSDETLIIETLDQAEIALWEVFGLVSPFALNSTPSSPVN